jgi:hypothetical protein
MNLFQSASLSAPKPSFTVASLGESSGSHTSYQLSEANFAFGTPLGGRRTVPMRKPSPRSLGMPRRTTLAVIE